MRRSFLAAMARCWDLPALLAEIAKDPGKATPRLSAELPWAQSALQRSWLRLQQPGRGRLWFLGDLHEQGP